MDKKKIIRYLTIGFLFFVIMLFLYIKSYKKEKNYEFKGIIEKVSYSDKKMPIVQIKGKTYFISFPNEYFREKIETGDSLIKEKKSKIYKLIKSKSGEVIFSE